jgi:DNA repair exonuclease SbcCD nuclease subunit
MDPIKVLTIGDPHFKVGNVKESEEMTQKLINLTKETKPTFIVCLGDILHRHETIHVAPLMRAEEMIRLLSEVAPTFVIVGNHDRPNNSNYLTNEHPFNAMKRWNNTYVVDNVVPANIKGYNFIFLPYVPPGRFEDAINTIKNNEDHNPLENVSALFCHQEFFGAKMGAIKSQAGDKWPINNPLVISGHVHDYDRLQSNLIYVGTPMQHAFGDSSDKTVSLFTFNGDGTWEEERKDLGLIKRVIVYLTPEKINTYEPDSDKLVKIVIRGNEAEIKATMKLDRIKQLKEKGIKISFKTLHTNDNHDLNHTISNVKMRYKDRLYSEIKSEPNQTKWFDKLF